MSNPAITVVIDTYNHETFIEQAISSVLDQDFPREDFEVLVVDDGSTDRTGEIVRKFEPQVRYLRKENGGQASAFNAGIPLAQGEILSFLDGDDWWYPHKLSRVAQAMCEDPSVGIVGHGLTVVHTDGHTEALTLNSGFHFRANTAGGAGLFRARRAFLGTSRMAIRKSLLRRIGPVPDSLLVEADEYLFTLAAVCSDVQILQEPLAYYRIHENNLFQFTQADPIRARRKQQVLQALSNSLSEQLKTYPMEQTARRSILSLVRAEADQLRLRLDGGRPWEIMRVEWILYNALEPEIVPMHVAFKILGLLPSLLMPPRAYYATRERLVRSGRYRATRERLLPVPRQPHISRGANAAP